MLKIRNEFLWHNLRIYVRGFKVDSLDSGRFREGTIFRQRRQSFRVDIHLVGPMLYLRLIPRIPTVIVLASPLVFKFLLAQIISRILFCIFYFYKIFWFLQFQFFRMAEFSLFIVFEANNHMQICLEKRALADAEVQFRSMIDVPISRIQGKRRDERVILLISEFLKQDKNITHIS